MSEAQIRANMKSLWITYVQAMGDLRIESEGRFREKHGSKKAEQKADKAYNAYASYSRKHGRKPQPRQH